MFIMTAHHPSGIRRKLNAHAGTIEEVAELFASCRNSIPNYSIEVVNTLTGAAHEFLPSESFDSNAITEVR